MTSNTKIFFKGEHLIIWKLIKLNTIFKREILVRFFKKGEIKMLFIIYSHLKIENAESSKVKY